MADDPRVTERIERAVDELDRTIRRIRTTIFELQPTRLGGRSVRREVLEVVAESARALGWEPDVAFDGPVDTLSDERATEHLVAAVRELLANVARHAGASHASVTIVGDGSGVVLTVEDDGRGPGEIGAGGRGVANLRARAASLDGSFELAPREGGGTLARWSITLKA